LVIDIGNLINKTVIEKKVEELIVSHFNNFSDYEIQEYFQSGTFIDDTEKLLRDAFEDIEDILNRTDASDMIKIMMGDLYPDQPEKYEAFKDMLETKQGDLFKADIENLNHVMEVAENGTEEEKQAINDEYSNWVDVIGDTVIIVLDQHILQISITEEVVLLKIEDKDRNLIDERAMVAPHELMVVRRVLKIAYPHISIYKEDGLTQEEFERLYQILYNKAISCGGEYAKIIIEQDKQYRPEPDQDFENIVDSINSFDYSDPENFDQMDSQQIREHFFHDKAKKADIPKASLAFDMDKEISELSNKNVQMLIDNFKQMTINQIGQFLDRAGLIADNFDMDSYIVLFEFLDGNFDKLPSESEIKIYELREKLMQSIMQKQMSLEDSLRFTAYFGKGGDYADPKKMLITIIQEENPSLNTDQAYDLAEKRYRDAQSITPSNTNIDKKELAKIDKISNKIYKENNWEQIVEDCFDGIDLDLENPDMLNEMQTLQKRFADTIVEKVDQHMSEGNNVT
jgi:hypothetical protein